MPTEDKTLAVNAWVTARAKVTTKVVVLTCPSDTGEGNYYTPPQEIYLSFESVARLAKWVAEEVESAST